MKPKQATIDADARESAFHEAGHAVFAMRYNTWLAINISPNTAAYENSFMARTVAGQIRTYKLRGKLNRSAFGWSGIVAEKLLIEPSISAANTWASIVDMGLYSNLSPTDREGIEAVATINRFKTLTEAHRELTAQWFLVEAIAGRLLSEFKMNGVAANMSWTKNAGWVTHSFPPPRL